MFSNLTDSVQIVAIFFKIAGNLLRKSPRLSHPARLFLLWKKQKYVPASHRCTEAKHFVFTSVCSHQESKLTVSVPQLAILFRYHSQNSSIGLRFLGLKIKHPTQGWMFYFECSHQESNLECRYRKPEFYPLNYESSLKK